MTHLAKYYFLLPLALLSISLSAFAEENNDRLLINPGIEQINTLNNKCLYILEDHTQKMTLQQVINAENNSHFKKFEAFGQFKYSSAYWGKITIVNNSGLGNQWLLNIAPSHTNYAEVYFKKNDGNQFSLLKTGEFVSYQEKAYPKKKDCKILIEIPHQKEIELFIKLHNIDKSSPEFDLSLESVEHYYSSLEDGNKFEGVFLGVIGIIILYNLLIYKLHKDRVHLYFALYTLTASIFFIYEYGYALESIFQRVPVLNRFLLQIVLLSPLFFLRFIGSYTQSSFFYFKRQRWVSFSERLVLIIFGLSLVVLLIWFDAVSVEVFNFCAYGLFLLETLLVSLFLLRRKEKAESFIVIGTLALLIFNIVAINLNLFGEVDHYVNFILAGFLVQIFSYSLGLGFRLKLKEVEKVKEQNRLISELRKNENRTAELNSQLEAQIEERGYKLNQHQKEIALQAKELVEMNWELYEKNGELEDTNAALEDTNGKLIQSNTELNKLNARLNNTLAKLKEAQVQLIQSEKMASIGVLTAGIAHEINNPINFVYAGTDTLVATLKEIMGIMGEYEKISSQNSVEEIFSFLNDIEQIKKDISFDESKEDVFGLLGDIKEGARRTAEIVQGLRSFSRLDQEQVKKSSIHDGLESTLALLRSELKDEIEVIKHYDTDLPEVECVPGQINQVFMNILINAAQAVHENGRAHKVIEIKTIAKVLEFPGGRAVGNQEVDEIEIHITDSGKGIQDAILNRVFEPFFTTKKVGEGTGLGLSITHSIIQKHHGTIEVRSDGKSTTSFVITLPTTQARE